MADEKDPTAPEEKNGQPLTTESFPDELDALLKRAKAAGVRPLQVMVSTYTKKARIALEGFLESLENAETEKKK